MQISAVPPGANASTTAPRDAWVYRASKAQLVAIAVAVGIALFLLSCGLDVAWALYRGVTLLAMMVADFLVGALCGALLLKLMLAGRARQARLMARLETVAEMNHHIRNALENIQLTAYTTHDQQVMAEIRAATERIQWALREVSTKAAKPTHG